MAALGYLRICIPDDSSDWHLDILPCISRISVKGPRVVLAIDIWTCFPVYLAYLWKLPVLFSQSDKKFSTFLEIFFYRNWHTTYSYPAYVNASIVLACHTQMTFSHLSNYVKFIHLATACAKAWKNMLNEMNETSL